MEKINGIHGENEWKNDLSYELNMSSSFRSIAQRFNNVLDVANNVFLWSEYLRISVGSERSSR